MSKEIGELLYRLRTEAELTLEQLSQGVCSVAQMGKIEANQLAPDYFVFDRLFARLGKSVDRLEYILPVETYELYEMRFFIQREICYGRLTEAEQKLEEFKKSRQTDKKLHRQFILQERAQIAWMKGEPTEVVLEYLNAAIAETIPVEELGNRKLALSAEELKLLLFRWEVCRKTDYERPIKELQDILFYKNLKQMDAAEKAKWFPYAVLLRGIIGNLEKENAMLEMLTKEALSLLRAEGRLLYMPEILEQYAGMLEYHNGDETFIRLLRSEKETLLKVEAEYGISFEKFRLFEHTVRRFQLDSELIRKERKAIGMSQEELSDGICASETLARIESGKRSPREQKMIDLLRKMKRERKKINSIIMTDNYEVLWLKRKFNSMLNYKEYDKAGEILNQLETRLDSSIPQNEQFLRGERVKILYHQGAWTPEQCLEELKKQLSVTLNVETDEIFKHELTTEEHSILNEMAVIYYENQEEDKAIQIWEQQVESFSGSRIHPAFHILGWELAMGNLASGMEEHKKPLTSIDICKEKLKISMEAGRGNPLGRSMITMACALEQQNQEECLYAFAYGLDLLNLYKMEYRHRLVLQYILKPDFPFREALKNYRPLFHQYPSVVELWEED